MTLLYSMDIRDPHESQVTVPRIVSESAENPRGPVQCAQ